MWPSLLCRVLMASRSVLWTLHPQTKPYKHNVVIIKPRTVCVCVADVGYHELQLAVSQHRQWLENSWSLNSSQTSREVSGKKILSRYLQGMRHLRDSIASQLITYDIHAMIVSTVILWTVSLYCHLLLIRDNILLVDLRLRVNEFDFQQLFVFVGCG